VGFEPTVGVNPHLLSREAQSTGLCHLSKVGECIGALGRAGRLSACLSHRRPLPEETVDLFGGESLGEQESLGSSTS
jgi:hypothetical protein